MASDFSPDSVSQHTSFLLIAKIKFYKSGIEEMRQLLKMYDEKIKSSKKKAIFIVPRSVNRTDACAITKGGNNVLLVDGNPVPIGTLNLFSPL